VNYLAIISHLAGAYPPIGKPSATKGWFPQGITHGMDIALFTDNDTGKLF